MLLFFGIVLILFCFWMFFGNYFYKERSFNLRIQYGLLFGLLIGLLIFLLSSIVVALTFESKYVLVSTTPLYSVSINNENNEQVAIFSAWQAKGESSYQFIIKSSDTNALVKETNSDVKFIADHNNRLCKYEPRYDLAFLNYLWKLKPDKSMLEINEKDIKLGFTFK